MMSTYHEPGLGRGMDPDRVLPLSPNEESTAIMTLAVFPKHQSRSQDLVPEQC